MASKPPSKTKMRRLSRYAILPIIVVGGILGYSTWQRSSSPPVAVTSLIAERGSIEELIRENGVVQLASQQAIQSPVEGTVEQVMVQPGEQVIIGQPLMRLLSVEITAEGSQRVTQQETVLERSQSRVAEAESQLAVYRSALEEYQGETPDFFSDSEVEEGVPDDEVSELEENIRQTERALEEARLAAEAAQKRLERLQTEARASAPEPEETVVNSPITGQVLNVSAAAGSEVQPQATLLTLADPSQELVSLDLTAAAAARITLGQEARVTSTNADPFEGRVVQISPSARSPQEGSSPAGQDTASRVPVLVRLNQPSGSLVPGSEVRVELILESRENATVLDTRALQRSDRGNPFVWVVDNEQQAQSRPVQVGLEGLGEVEIEAGLRPNETVLLPPPERDLTSGMPVVIKPSL